MTATWKSIACAICVLLAGSAECDVSVTASRAYVDRKTTLVPVTNSGEVVGYTLSSQTNKVLASKEYVDGRDAKTAYRLMAPAGDSWIDGTGTVWQVVRAATYDGKTSLNYHDYGNYQDWVEKDWWCGYDQTGFWYLMRYLDAAGRLIVQYNAHGLPGVDGTYELKADPDLLTLDGEPITPGQVTDDGWYQISDGEGNIYSVSPLVATVTVERVTNAVDRLATRNTSITTNDVCNIVTNEVSELTEWTFSGDLDANATYELNMDVYELNGLWWCDAFIWGSTQAQPEKYRVYDVIISNVTYEAANQAAESTMEVSGTIHDMYEDVDVGFMTATRRRVVRNALGLARLADIPTNNVQLSNGSGYATSNDVVELINEHGGGGDWQLVTNANDMANNAYTVATNCLTRKEAIAGFTEWTLKDQETGGVVTYDGLPVFLSYDEYSAGEWGWHPAVRDQETGDIVGLGRYFGDGESVSLSWAGSDDWSGDGGFTATRTRLPTMSDLALKADKGEMSVTPGTGADADKATIQLKAGTGATVLTQHQQLAPVYSQTPTFSDWQFSDGLDHTLLGPTKDDANDVWYYALDSDGGLSSNAFGTEAEALAATELTFYSIEDIVATRTSTYAIVGYTLGAQTNDVLASANADTSYPRYTILTNINQSVQYLSIADEAPSTLSIQIPADGRTKDWVVYVTTVTNATLSLPAGTWWMADHSYTNDIAPATPTALWFSQVTDGVYILGRQELVPIAIATQGE